MAGQQQQTNSAPGQNPDLGNVSDGFIINELLCFVRNKLDIMDTDAIVQLCVSFYSDDAIVEAKNKLFHLCEDELNVNDGGKIDRRGPNKNVENVKDIIKLFLENSDTAIPIFVAMNLPSGDHCAPHPSSMRWWADPSRFMIQTPLPPS